MIENPEKMKEICRSSYLKRIRNFQVDSFDGPSEKFFPSSDGQINPYIGENSDHEAYKIMEENFFQGNPDKTDFGKIYPRCGHKVHLNVLPSDVLGVAEYLQEQGYDHKYLSGSSTTGDQVASGKIFTVYLGSKDIAKKLSKKLSKDLEGKLCQPYPRDEIEYAKNVVGRFDIQGIQGFHQYGIDVRGLNILKKDVRTLRTAYRNDRENIGNVIQEILGRSYEKTSKLFGSYFYGREPS